jgi:hypothetical protein
MSTVSQCANPRCFADFLRLSDGKLFQCPPEQAHGARHLQCAWLCEVCRKSYTVDWHDGKVVLSPMRRWSTYAARAD